MARATSPAESGEAHRPYPEIVATLRTYPVHRPQPVPGESRAALYSEHVRFPAYLLTKTGEVIRPAVVELADTELPPGEVLVRVEWSAVNFKDAMVAGPGNRVAHVFPLVPGVELAGIVESRHQARQHLREPARPGQGTGFRAG